MRGPGRFVFSVLAVVGAVWVISSLFGAIGSAAAGAATVGAALLIPLFFAFKLLFVLMLFGFFGRMIGRRVHDGSWGEPHDHYRRYRPSSRDSHDRASAEESSFEEWHRMAHARDEVDGWVEDV